MAAATANQTSSATLVLDQTDMSCCRQTGLTYRRHQLSQGSTCSACAWQWAVRCALVWWSAGWCTHFYFVVKDSGEFLTIVDLTIDIFAVLVFLPITPDSVCQSFWQVPLLLQHCKFDFNVTSPKQQYERHQQCTHAFKCTYMKWPLQLRWVCL